MSNKPTDGPDFKDWDWDRFKEWRDRLEREKEAKEKRERYINKF